MSKCVEVTVVFHLPEDYDYTSDWRGHEVFDQIADVAFEATGLGDVSMFGSLVDGMDK